MSQPIRKPLYNEEGFSNEERICPYCDDTGCADYDRGGGNTRRGYCDCPAGEKAADYTDGMRDAKADMEYHAKVDEGER